MHTQNAPGDITESDSCHGNQDEVTLQPEPLYLTQTQQQQFNKEINYKNNNSGIIFQIASGKSKVSRALGAG